MNKMEIGKKVAGALFEDQAVWVRLIGYILEFGMSDEGQYEFADDKASEVLSNEEMVLYGQAAISNDVIDWVHDHMLSAALGSPPDIEAFTITEEE